MKKFIILIGTLLLAAVFMSGCITAQPPTEDPVIGIWMNTEQYTDPKGVVYDSHTYVFKSDGTGYSLTEFDGERAYGKLDFTWKNDGNEKYTVTFADTKGTGVPPSFAFSLSDDTITVLAGEATPAFHRASLEEYVVGLWVGEKVDVGEHTDVQGLFYFGEDGKGTVASYIPDVKTMDDVFKADFTWKAEDDKIIMTGDEVDAIFELVLVNGELLMGELPPMHKYTVEDNLYGLWKSVGTLDGVTYDVVELIRSDGTGVELWTVSGSDTVSERYTFTWKMIDSTTLEAVYDDGGVWQYEMIGLRLYDGDSWFDKVGFDILTQYAESKVTA